MKTHTKILFLGLYLLSTITMNAQLITIESGIRKDDGSSSLRKRDSLHLKPFSIENVDKEIPFKERTEVNFELIGTNDVQRIFPLHKYTLVFIQASGCGACPAVLRKHKAAFDSLPSEDIKIIVINRDIDVRQLQKKIFGEKYHFPSYILNPEIYGTVEIKKQEQFVMELTKGSALEDYSSRGVPVCLLFDRNGDLVFYNPNNTVSTALIKEKIAKK